MEKRMAMGYSLTPMAPCMRASGSMTSNMAMAARAGTIIKSNILANLSTAKSQETAGLSLKADTTRATSLMANSTAMASITSQILASSMKENSKIITWTEKASSSGQTNQGTRVISKQAKCMARARSTSQTAIDT